MKKTAVFAVLLLCIAAVLTAGCITDEPAEPIDYPTALVGDWKSVEKMSYGDREFHVIYHFNDDGMGTMDGEMNGKVFSSIILGWGYLESENRYVIGYPGYEPDFLYISEDGKTVVNQDGAKFKKL